MFMLPNSEDIKVIFSAVSNINDLLALSPLEPFSDEIVEFLHELSVELVKYSRGNPDIATFSFYCRKSNILNLKKKHFREQSLRLGRGIVFHIAPSNVPVNFAYSLVSGLLAGNVNIVKVPSKEFPQVEIISKAINKLYAEGKYKSVAERILLVRYDRSVNAVTEYFSSNCDVRVIWGGDESIRQIRKATLPPRSYDISFADRYSFCLINADTFVHDEKPENICNGFYNDTYLFDQNACTAPHLIIWLGKKENVAKAQSKFWDILHKIVYEKYGFQEVTAVDKLTTFFNQAVRTGISLRLPTPDNLIWRVKLLSLPKNIDEFRCASGYFSEFHAESLAEIAAIITRKYQTLAYSGFDKSLLSNFIRQFRPNGIDRIVPIGRTMDFSLNWDGFDLISTLSRSCEII
jgi:hypothetical protein